MGKTIVFDTLAYANKLKAAGVPQQQAEIHAEAFAEIIEERLATKQDLKELEYRLTIRIGGMLIVAVGILLAAKLFA
jgi:hypothetical protein